MDRATRRSRVLKNLGFTDQDVSTTDLDAELDRIFRFEIPNRVGGGAYRREVTFDLVASQDTYDLDTIGAAVTPTPLHIHGVRNQMVVLNGEPIYYTTDPFQFFLIHDPDATNENEPSELLVDGRQLIFRPTPDAIYSCTLRVSAARDPLEIITDELEAETVVRGATFYLAAQRGMDEIGGVFLDLYNASMAQMATKYRGNAASQHIRRDF